jgi:homoserine kinase
MPEEISRPSEFSEKALSAGDPLLLRVPASTSNCGPGFDTLGIALTLHNFIEVHLREDAEIVCRNEFPPQTLEMACEVAETFAEETGHPPCGFEFDLWGEIPRARGLGSSASIRCGLLAALNRFSGNPLDETALIRLGARLDGAPDGVAACFRGGFVASRMHPETRAYLSSERFEVPENIAMVAVAPDQEVLTNLAREALPGEIPFDDVVRSLNSLTSIVLAFATGKYANLRGAVTDFVHQPYRERLCPFTKECIAAGVDAGAWCGWLSGSGSTILCVAPQTRAINVGQAMKKVFDENGMNNRLLKLRTANTGLVFLDPSAQAWNGDLPSHS